MSKYQRLADRLAGLAGPEWRATFAEIEKLLGSALPKAAAGKAWWADGAAARQWIDAGWTAEADPAAGKVVFRKTAAEPAAQPPVVADEPPILKRLEGGPGWGVALALGGVAVVAGIGALVFRGLRRKA